VASAPLMDGTTYSFVSWSDGGAMSHPVSTPGTNSTFTVTFQGQTTAPSSSGSGHGGGACGLLGLEAALVLALWKIRRRAVG